MSITLTPALRLHYDYLPAPPFHHHCFFSVFLSSSFWTDLAAQTLKYKSYQESIVRTGRVLSGNHSESGQFRFLLPTEGCYL